MVRCMSVLQSISLGVCGHEHREGVADGFTKRYGLCRLVYAEHHANILSAKEREMNIKHWPRAWKVRLIHQDNPYWDDLYDRLA